MYSFGVTSMIHNTTAAAMDNFQGISLPTGRGCSSDARHFLISLANNASGILPRHLKPLLGLLEQQKWFLYIPRNQEPKAPHKPYSTCWQRTVDKHQRTPRSSLVPKSHCFPTKFKMLKSSFKFERHLTAGSCSKVKSEKKIRKNDNGGRMFSRLRWSHSDWWLTEPITTQ